MQKVALITGAGRGIGKAIAETLANAGYAVAVNYNKSKKQAQALVENLIKQGKQAMAVHADVSSELDVINMVNAVVEKFGTITALVNNAAYSVDKLFQDKTVEDFNNTFNVNVNGTFLVSKHVGDLMFKNKFGKIVNISSTNGINTYFPMCAEYDASKAAIISLTHNLSIQFAPYVNVNAVAPGFIATESEIGGMDEEFIKMEEEKIFLKRVGLEQEVAFVVEFLLSDKASYVNNEVIRVDGGMYGNY